MKASFKGIVACTATNPPASSAIGPVTATGLAGFSVPRGLTTARGAVTTPPGKGGNARSRGTVTAAGGGGGNGQGHGKVKGG